MKLALFLTLALTSVLVQDGLSSDPQIRKAQIAVYKESHTREGKHYDAKIGKELESKYRPVLKACVGAAKPEERKTFTLYTQVDKDGKVESVLQDPANGLTDCIRKIMAKDAFSPPPHPDYWVQMTIELRH